MDPRVGKWKEGGRDGNGGMVGCVADLVAG